jgi:hypothetical protein
MISHGFWCWKSTAAKRLILRAPDAGEKSARCADGLPSFQAHVGKVVALAPEDASNTQTAFKSGFCLFRIGSLPQGTAGATVFAGVDPAQLSVYTKRVFKRLLEKATWKLHFASPKSSKSKDDNRGLHLRSVVAQLGRP